MHAPRADARAKTGAYDTRSAASAALLYFEGFGVLNEPGWAERNGEQNIKVEAAAVTNAVSMQGSARQTGVVVMMLCTIERSGSRGRAC